MGFFGKTDATDATALNADANVGWLSRYTLSERGRVGHLSAYVDGERATSGEQSVKAVIYSIATDRARLAVSEEVAIVGGRDPGWVEFRFADPLLLEEGDYYMGLIGGGGNVARFYATATGGVGVSTRPSSYAAPEATFTGGSTNTRRLALWAHYRAPDDLSADEDDEYYGRLGWHTTQEVFSSTGPVPGSAQRVTCGWHGEAFHNMVGAFAVVRTDGPLADLVGERLRVSYEGRQVYVYCTDEKDIADTEDISLSRIAFARLALLSTDELTVDVEVMG